MMTAPTTSAAAARPRRQRKSLRSLEWFRKNKGSEQGSSAVIGADHGEA